MSLRKVQSDGNLPLELFLSNNQLRLATPDALYSDGLGYPPAVKFLNHARLETGNVGTALLLGAGIGSVIGLMNRKGYAPQFTLVDVDQVILNWAVEANSPKNVGKLHPVCESAELFLAHNNAKFDLIFVDVFIGRVVPEFVMQESFLSRCRQALDEGGMIGLNYIVNDDDDWYRDSATFMSVFPEAELISFDMNRVFVCRLYSK